MRPSAVLTVAWLPLVLLYTDQRASALPPDSLVQIKQSRPSTSCLPPVITTRSVRFYSVKTAGGSLYVRHLISLALLNCFQVAGGAMRETAKDFATCANTAEKKKKNVFQFADGVCTTYAAMPPSVLLPPCSGVGDAVVYVVKTALNSATLPLPKVTNIELSANPISITASWTVQDTCNLTQSYKVTAETFASLLVVSTAGFNLMNNVSSVSIPAGYGSQMTYNMDGVSPCSNTSVTVTPQYLYGKDFGTSMTVNTTGMPPDNITTPSFDGVVYGIVTLDNTSVTWNFRGCASIAAYVLTYVNNTGSYAPMTLNTSVTSLVRFGFIVCSDYYTVEIKATANNGTTVATTQPITSYDDSLVYTVRCPKQSGCLMTDFTSAAFSDALAYCSTLLHGELFSYGNVYYRKFTIELFAISGWVDLQYSPTTSQWVWGNGEVEPTNSSIWYTTPDPAVGHCATGNHHNRNLTATDCNLSKEVDCFKFY